ncbi:MAG: flagellar assembly protein H [Oculatellaceae cyanobacterium Prado106]|jgi:hypothetical protein|nr:flagellar assembly protein H [Oculatellaceae cyanobacterium Prado106]
MTTKPFDQFNKRLFQELLSPFGQVIPDLAVLGEERLIDVFFAPFPGATPDFSELGVLAQMVTQPALLEPFRSALSDEDLQFCLLKLFLVYADQKRANPTIPVTEPAKLWILAAEVSDRLLHDFKGEIDPDLGEGFYLLSKGLKTTIVAIAELPTVPETLWLRLMGKDRTQEDAIAELLQMPEADPKRSNALNLLVSWRINIEVTNSVESEEQRILMALSQTYLEWEKQTERRGREQGREQERRSIILTSLQSRYGELDPALEAIVPKLMELTNSDWLSLVLRLSKEEMLEHFTNAS